MANLIRLTDAELTLRFHGLDLTTIDSTPIPIVSIRQGGLYCESSSVTIVDSEKMIASFSQRETERFKPRTAEVQVNYWIEGKRKAIEQIPVTIGENNTDRVIDIE